MRTVDMRWLPQESLQNTKFTIKDDSVFGDNILGQAGVARELSLKAGVWIGTYINSARDDSFDHRIAIHAGKALAAGYATNQVHVDGGYAVRIVSDDGRNAAVELWNGKQLAERLPGNFQFTKCVHVTVGFATDGLVVGRVVDAQTNQKFDFEFAPRTILSQGKAIAFSGIAVGYDRPVFEKVLYLPTDTTEDFKSKDMLDLRSQKLRWIKKMSSSSSTPAPAPPKAETARTPITVVLLIRHGGYPVG